MLTHDPRTRGWREGGCFLGLRPDLRTRSETVVYADDSVGTSRRDPGAGLRSAPHCVGTQAPATRGVRGHEQSTSSYGKCGINDPADVPILRMAERQTQYSQILALSF